MCFCFGLVLFPPSALANSENTYFEAISVAGKGDDVTAIRNLRNAVDHLSATDPWHARMTAAASMLEMRWQRSASPRFRNAEMHQILVEAHLRQHPIPARQDVWLVGLMATLMPGSGHAWQGRWRDAEVAAFMVWPMLILTLWAARRRMGPVTVFFSLITLWLWSGTIFSAVSLVERGNDEQYILWWQELWLASGLQGSPW
ncbi:MAG: hypothetical protein ACE5DY_02740 [Mariprofundaceae bacterium]